MSSPIRLIATDLDGTLVHTDGTVSERNRAALRAVRAAGIRVAVCTGRRHSYAMRALRPAVLEPEEVIISTNGVVTRSFGGDLFWRATLSPDLVRRMCAVLQEYRDALVLTFDRNGPGGTDAPGALAVEQLDTLHGSIRRWMEVNASSLQRFTRIEDALGNAPDGENEDANPGQRPIQAMLCGGMERIRNGERLLQQHFATEVETFRTEYPGKDLCILDIVPVGYSKGATLRRLANRFSIPMEQVLVLGDNWNDLPMFEVAGKAVVLGNAPEELLRLARERQWWLGAPGDADGFADAVAALTGVTVPGSGEHNESLHGSALSEATQPNAVRPEAPPADAV